MPARGATARTDSHQPGLPRGNNFTAPKRHRATLSVDGVIRILTYNVRSIRAHIVEIKKMSVEWLSREVDILVFTESWLKSGDETPRLPGYVEAGRKDRSENWGSKEGRGGGVLIYVRDRMGYSIDQIDYNRGTIHEGIDFLSINIRRGGKRRIQLVGVYVPPNLSDEVWEEQILDWNIRSNEKGALVIAGDINSHGSWSSMSTVAGDRIEEWCVTKGIEILNDPVIPTRIATTTNSMGDRIIQLSSPDVIMVKTADAINSMWESFPEESCGSDHIPIQINLLWPDKTNLGHVKYRKKWKLKKADWDLFRERLRVYCVDSMKDGGRYQNAQELYDLLESNIKSALIEAVPRTTRAREYIWWTDEVEGAVKTRREALKKFRESGLEEDGDIYEQARGGE
ncbi:hypothetical protein FOZ60_015589 [Perkinsus olseni]|uniref:Endonuclease/exonuclease/phosphatase domain-containing protein n=1 Tax=Perkinsus olseni TaxID=32597 RepID=A0A7J6N5R0_PEROL|nr:hypothetical protein FOZ60_015589 [Perkinsus olseni]